MQEIADRVVQLIDSLEPEGDLTAKIEKLIESEEGYSFEVESDFWDWEMSLDGIETIQNMIETLKGSNGDNSAGH